MIYQAFNRGNRANTGSMPCGTVRRLLPYRYMEYESNAEERFFEAYDAHADAIFRHCYYRVSDRELAKDLMQEAFARTWEYIIKGNNPENLRAFVYRVAGNLIIDHYRKKKTYSLDALAEEKGFDPPDMDATDRIINESDAKRALSLLPELPEPHRSVFVMRYVDGLTPREIAEITGEHENAVSVRTHRAVKKLRDCIQKGQNI